MGWTSYMATEYKNGKVNVKAEMDKRYTWETDYYTNKVIKSAMKGNIYYCAVETLGKEDDSREVWAGIARTSTDTSDGMNFGYKDMDETMIPCYYDCPKGILDLLTPTRNKEANEWRTLCEKHRTAPKLTDVKVGDKIKWKLWNGEEKELIKMSPNYQFKRTWWYCPESGTYVPSKRIVNWEML